MTSLEKSFDVSLFHSNMNFADSSSVNHLAQYTVSTNCHVLNALKAQRRLIASKRITP